MVNTANMKRDASFFEGQEPSLVYIAKRLRDALRLEKVFTDAGLDYGVEADQYFGGIVFRRERIGAFFYVLPEVTGTAHKLMRDNGFEPYQEGA